MVLDPVVFPLPILNRDRFFFYRKLSSSLLPNLNKIRPVETNPSRSPIKAVVGKREQGADLVWYGFITITG